MAYEQNKNKWDSKKFDDYSKKTRGMSAKELETAKLSTEQVFVQKSLHKSLNPYGVMRECFDCKAFPESNPNIIGIDITGSMGSAARKVAQKVDTMMRKVYDGEFVKFPEFCFMAIGDVNKSDKFPIQISQFETDIRIAEQLDNVYFEGGGGGNHSESYSAVWYMGLRHCNLDCWKRGKKGLIITTGDELPNIYLDHNRLNAITGDHLEADVNTADLYRDACEKYDIYHISVDDLATDYSFNNSIYNLDGKWRELLGDNYRVATLDTLVDTIVGIIVEHNMSNNETVIGADLSNAEDSTGYISW